jgi:hypothetical protein
MPLLSPIQNAASTHQWKRWTTNSLTHWARVKEEIYLISNSLGTLDKKPYPTHTWSSALHLRDNEFHHPCVRCEHLHTGMDHYQVYGERCVIWRNVYAPMNCAEPLCLSTAIEADKFGKLYHTTFSEQNWRSRITWWEFYIDVEVVLQTDYRSVQERRRNLWSCSISRLQWEKIEEQGD